MITLLMVLAACGHWCNDARVEVVDSNYFRADGAEALFADPANPTPDECEAGCDQGAQIETLRCTAEYVQLEDTADTGGVEWILVECTQLVPGMCM